MGWLFTRNTEESNTQSHWICGTIRHDGVWMFLGVLVFSR